MRTASQISCATMRWLTRFEEVWDHVLLEAKKKALLIKQEDDDSSDEEDIFSDDEKENVEKEPPCTAGSKQTRD